MTVLKTFGMVAALFSAAALAVPEADAQSRRSGVEAKAKSGATRGRVAGFERRIGGYSYSYDDATIDFRDDALSDDPSLVRQDSVFDGGFWFDSTAGAPTRDESPYP